MIPDIHQRHATCLKLWRAILAPLLGWSEERIGEWASQFEKYFDGKDYWFHSDGPFMCIAKEFIPIALKDGAHGREVEDLIWTIDKIIRDFVEQVANADKLSEADWETVRRQIDFVLHQYGSSLREIETKCNS